MKFFKKLLKKNICMQYYMFNHPKNVCMTYIQHLKLSFNFSWLFFKGCVLALIHAVIPDFFITSTSDIKNEIDYLLKTNGCRKNKK